MSDSKFSPFEIHTTPYKSIHDQSIPLHILLPKSVSTGHLPVLIHFHGGFFFTGTALFADWNAQWNLSYILKHNAIRVSPNYRLLPESTGMDILSDVQSAFSWVEHELEPYLRSIGSQITPDLTKLAVYGESAGGYLAILSALQRPDLVKAVIAAYPVTYIDSPWYMEASTTKSPFGAPQVPQIVLDNYLSDMKSNPGKIVTEAIPMARMDIAFACLQGGRFGEFLGKEEELFPARIVEKMDGKNKMPYLFVLHGKQDSAVPCEDSVKFVELWASKFGERKVKGVFEDGEHGFDGEATLETEWLKNGLVEVTKAWLD
jgi:acetyl esterase/lipase